MRYTTRTILIIAIVLYSGAAGCGLLVWQRRQPIEPPKLAVPAGADKRSYPATVLSVYDGDTVTASVDLGFDLSLKGKMRLLGINAPELNQAGGAASRDYLRGLLPTGTIIRLSDVKQDKYGGRWDAILWTADGTNVNQKMLDSGNAWPYNP